MRMNVNTALYNILVYTNFIIFVCLSVPVTIPNSWTDFEGTFTVDS